MSTKPPILLIHGFWVTPRSCEHWVTHFEKKGHQVIAPAYSGFEVEVEALNADPSPITAMRIPAIIERMEFRSPSSTPRRSPWATRQAARGRSSCSTAATASPASPSARRPPRACSSHRTRSSSRLSPSSGIPRTSTARRRLSFEEWHYAFTNAFTEAKGRARYERYHIPTSGNIVWDSVLAKLIPFKQDAAVDGAMRRSGADSSGSHARA